ncbi:MAG: family 10 glycosylhydrolase [Defluviitaleaceae bacterium]|nr:family 10 glycosylhydrolase [Defluviitaleaceae bacterium]
MHFSYNGSQLNAQFSNMSNDPLKQRAKAELRGVWVTTVRNNDFPSPAVFEQGFKIDLFKKEFAAILATCRKFKLNALFFQVRPEGDAFYPSGVNPWSQYLTGEQGTAPGMAHFDPLAYVIQETHQAGMEFHAWLNPYRLTPSTSKLPDLEAALATLAPTHYARRHRDWIYFYNGQLYLNPGVPEVNAFMVQTVDEILNRYAVDAIHLDDFFYPYPYPEGDEMIAFGDLSPDQKTYEQYRVDANQTIDDWRQANINELVYQLHKTISRYNYSHQKHVEFGISPFGIWASEEEAPGGSKTSPIQLSSLDEYVNSKLWVQAGWLDYIVPQVYWAFDDPLSPFDIVAQWWNDITANTKTKLYIGLGLYLYEEDQMWQDPNEIIRQITFIRNLPHVSGFVFFTYRNLVADLATTKTLKEALKLLRK